MQTFLPYPSFRRSARVLDEARLGKQRVEALQILRALHFPDYGWRTHPAVRMWRGHEAALVAYGVAMCAEWTRRGHPDTCRAQIEEFADGRAESQAALRARGALPRWLGWRPLHRSHRSVLARKRPSHYRRLFPGVPESLPYAWPPLAEDGGPDAGPVAAWVVRAPAARVARVFLEAGVVALPDAASARARKAGRQIAALRDGVRCGDAVLLVDGERLIVGEVTGPYRRERRRVRPHVRPVRWLGEIDRRALRRPARLQDPARLFPLRGELDPRRLLERASAAAQPAGSRR